jgi:DNA replication protein DnaC
MADMTYSAAAPGAAPGAPGATGAEAAAAPDRRMAQRLEQAQVPRRFWGAATELPVGSYFVSGPVGTGKTHLAAALAAKALAEGDGRLVSFRPVHALLGQLRSHNPHDPHDRSRDVVEFADMLVIDDLGKEAVTEWVLGQLFALIDSRYASMRITVVTSNLALSELAERYGGDACGQAIVSRIGEMCRQVRLTGPDRRLAGSGNHLHDGSKEGRGERR